MKQITKEVLEQLRKTQQREYYGSQAQAMFVDGIFNPNNWNGGDRLIRQYFSEYRDGLFNDQVAAEIEFGEKETEFSGDIIINHKWFEDQNYVTIIFHGWYGVDEMNDYKQQIDHIAYFTWYKSRGRTENALYNGRPMTEDEYLFVLNALQETGFDFDLQ
jgi:hypothetical protein